MNTSSDEVIIDYYQSLGLFRKVWQENRKFSCKLTTVMLAFATQKDADGWMDEEEEEEEEVNDWKAEIKMSWVGKAKRCGLDRFQRTDSIRWWNRLFDMRICGVNVIGLDFTRSLAA